jgi:hypothetical protein
MPTAQTIQKREDDYFFHVVATEPAFVRALHKFGFSPAWFGIAVGNAVMGISRPNWTIYVPASRHSLNIHFEARTRNEYRIEIGPEPYVSKLDKKPEIKEQFSALLKRRADIMDVLRDRLLKYRGLPNNIIVSRANLLDADKTAAHTVVKFLSALPADPSPAQSAAFFVQVIEIVTPIVDEVLEHLR